MCCGACRFLCGSGSEHSSLKFERKIPSSWFLTFLTFLKQNVASKGHSDQKKGRSGTGTWYDTGTYLVVLELAYNICCKNDGLHGRHNHPKHQKGVYRTKFN
jgi:hypothetical protein